jgi:hypothetical protein
MQQAVGGGGEASHLLEGVEQIVPVRVGPPFRLLEVELMLVQCPLAPLAGAGQQRGRDEPVVRQEAHEDAAQNHPGHRRLSREPAPPDPVSIARAPGVLRPAILLPQRCVDRRDLPNPLAQVILQRLKQALESLRSWEAPIIVSSRSTPATAGLAGGWRPDSS